MNKDQEKIKNQEFEGRRQEAKQGQVINIAELAKISPSAERILAKLDANIGSSETLVEINGLIIEELAKNPENALDLESFKIEIEKLSGTESEQEREGGIRKEDSEKRNVSLSEQIDKMEAGEEFDGKQLAAVLERQNWGKIFTGLSKGDEVISFLVPGAEFLSIKNLNDNIFGPTRTNKIIIEKRKVIEREIKKVDANALVLQSDYKTELIKKPKDSTITADQLEAVALAADKEMTAFIENMVDELIAETRKQLLPLITQRDLGEFGHADEKDKNRKDIKTLKDNINKWDQFKENLQGKLGKGGFKMNFGMAEVGDEGMADKLTALNHSLQTSRLARQNPDGYGAEYNEASIETELDSIKDLREKIINEHGNKITDSDDNEFEIFIKNDDLFALNTDVLRDVRKGKFKTKDQTILADIALYLKKLNILDTVKPFTMDEIGKVEEEIKIASNLSQKMKNVEKLDEGERKLAAQMLRSEAKDRAYTSKSEFEKRAIAMNGCAHIDLDVLDLGVDQILENENILQVVDRKIDKSRMSNFNELALSAGDLTTKKLKKFRKDVADFCKDFISGSGDGLVTADASGGDELKLAVDISNVSEEKLDKSVFALKEKTNSRVIKTVVAKSEKTVSADSDQQSRVEAHFQAIKRAETGVSIAKDIEEVARKYQRLLDRPARAAEAKKKLESFDGLFVIEGGKVKTNTVVIEENGRLMVAKDNNYKVDYNEIKSKLESVLAEEFYPEKIAV